MAVTIRRAEERDIYKTLVLLSEVHELHAWIRPDIFIPSTTKYSREELQQIFANDRTPVFVADDDGVVKGYAFCVIQKPHFSTSMKPLKTLYIDDLCVDETCRGQKIGTMLFDFVKAYAKEQGCYEVTLNVWEGNNNARRFYEKMGMSVKETTMEIRL